MHPYQATTLANGLRVLTYYDEHCPVAYINLMSRAGFRFERPEELGYAHLLEHMLMKGTSRYPGPDLLSEQVNRLGGYMNANTSQERVNYVMQIAREHTEGIVSLLHDMFFDSLIEPDRLEREKKVVLEEHENIRSNNERHFGYVVGKELFKGHPLGTLTLDSDDSTKAATVAGLRAYMERWYVPERSALVIGGGVPHEEAVRLAQQFFGHWPNSGMSSPEVVPFAPAHSPHLHFQRDIPITHIRVLYHAPGAMDDKAEAALAFVSTFMSYGQSSLLPRELRHKRSLVYGVGTSEDVYRDVGIFGLYTSTAQDAEQVVSLSRQFIEHVTDYLKPEDVEWLRKQKLGALARTMAEVSDRTSFLFGNFITLDRLYTPEEWIAALKAVTYDDIVRVTDQYLRRDNSLLATMGRTDPGEL